MGTRQWVQVAVPFPGPHSLGGLLMVQSPNAIGEELTIWLQRDLDTKMAPWSRAWSKVGPRKQLATTPPFPPTHTHVTSPSEWDLLQHRLMANGAVQLST